MGACAEPRNVAELRGLISAGERIRFLFFWGHQPGRDGIGKSCLSQWFEGYGFTVDGVGYATAEHWMMAQKARLFGDEDAFGAIVAARHPGEVKALGRRIGGFDEDTWAEHRFGIVATGNTAKFGQHAELRKFLLGTQDRVLAEASPRDRIWGIGLTEHDERAGEPAAWPGLNLLGFALMEARSRLRSQSQEPG